MKEFVEAIRKDDPERAEELIEEITAGLSELEEIPELSPREAEEIRIWGYNSIDKLAGASLDKLEKIPMLRKGRAFDVMDASREIVRKRLGKLPGVGPDRAEKLVKHGYTSMRDLAGASESDLSEIPKIGRKSAEVIIESARERQEGIEDLPGVGWKRAEEMRELGYESFESLAKVPEEELKKIEGVGEKTAGEIKKSAEERVGRTIEDLPGVGPDRAKEIRDHGFGSIQDLAGASLEDLIEVPCLKKGKAKMVLDSAGRLRDRIEGYRRALSGAISSLGQEGDLTLARKIANDEINREKMEEIRAEMEARATQEFRSPDERGFSEAWADILGLVLK